MKHISLLQRVCVCVRDMNTLSIYPFYCFAFGDILLCTWIFHSHAYNVFNPIKHIKTDFLNLGFWVVCP